MVDREIPQGGEVLSIEIVLEAFREGIYNYLKNPVSLSAGHFQEDDGPGEKVLFVQLSEVPDREERSGMLQTYKGYRVIYH